MHQHEKTLTAASPTLGGIEPGTTREAPAHGDFAAGLRTRARVAQTRGTFATGASKSSATTPRAVGDFATGVRLSRAGATGDFATGMRAGDLAWRRAGGAERPRVDLERELARKVAA